MSDIEEVIRRLIEISQLKLTGGWRAWVAGRDRFTKSQWQILLDEPEKLFDGVQQTLKSEGRNCVVVKYLTVGNRGVKAVLKYHCRGRGVRELFRSLRAARGLRNFIAAVKTSQHGLAVAAPLAAVFRSKFLLSEQSIYISEFVEGPNLYEFLKNLTGDSTVRFRTVCRLSEQIAEILALLHDRGLWHRDAKATNFIVSGGGPCDYRLVLTDMDGIKEYSFGRKEQRTRPLWQLAASVMNLPTIRRTDFLRVFRAYCDKTALPEEQRRNMLRMLAEKARAKYEIIRRRRES
jgi:serine/threonine protein kinase